MMENLVRALRRAVQRFFGIFGYRIVKQVPGSGAIVGYFVDSAGNRHPRFSKYKARVWPLNWQQMRQELANPTPKILSSWMQSGRNAIIPMEHMLSLHGFTAVGKDVLEIGTAAGAAAYALAELGAATVVGIDVPANYAVFDGPLSAEAILKKSEWLRTVRQDVQRSFLADGAKFQPEQVRFLNADIRELTANQSYDLIVSWATLEHIFEPLKAFQRIYAALRPGGLTYHAYHPFFCESGGHFETLDFPWGHVRLSSQDIDRYLALYCLDGLEVGRERVHSSINRMTLSDFKQVVASSGFNVIEWLEEGENWQVVSPQIYQESKKNYPSLTLTDLVTPRLTVVLQKPF